MSQQAGATVGPMGVGMVREKVVDMIGTLPGNELFAAYAALLHR